MGNGWHSYLTREANYGKQQVFCTSMVQKIMLICSKNQALSSMSKLPMPAWEKQEVSQSLLISQSPLIKLSKEDTSRILDKFKASKDDVVMLGIPEGLVR